MKGMFSDMKSYSNGDLTEGESLSDLELKA